MIINRQHGIVVSISDWQSNPISHHWHQYNCTGRVCDASNGGYSPSPAFPTPHSGAPPNLTLPAPTVDLPASQSACHTYDASHHLRQCPSIVQQQHIFHAQFSCSCKWPCAARMQVPPGTGLGPLSGKILDWLSTWSWNSLGALGTVTIFQSCLLHKVITKIKWGGELPILLWMPRTVIGKPRL